MLSLPRLNIIHRQLDRPRAVRKLLGHVQHTQRPRQLLRLRVDIEARIFMCVYLHLHTPTNVCVGRGRRAFVCECVRACMNSQKQKRQQQPCASSKLTSAQNCQKQHTNAQHCHEQRLHADNRGTAASDWKQHSAFCTARAHTYTHPERKA